MISEIWWKSLDEYGLEHLRLTETDDEIFVESLILQIIEGKPYHIKYHVRCDKDWFVREVEIDLTDHQNKKIKLSSDGRGNWTSENGKELSELSGCFDIDISATPFTNTLPIKRLKIQEGQTFEISVVYFLLPEMSFQRSQQSYERLPENSFRFEEKGVFKGFSADIKTDENGFVEDYPQLFERIQSY